MMRFAWMCPGQGAQYVGMGRDLSAEFEPARRTLEEANDALGFALDRLCFEGPEAELMLTENAQPALLAVSVATGRSLAATVELRPVIAAGHSLGEWSALVLAGRLDFADALRAVRARGRFMQEAVPAGQGAMSALLGADPAVAGELCEAASDATSGEIVVLANVNGAGQLVVAGHAEAVARLEGLARERRVRAMRLKVSAPFHCPLMAPARERMREVLAALPVAEAGGTVVSNVGGHRHADPATTRRLLEEQITAPVQWDRCADAVVGESDVAIEVGPGKVLSGLLRRIAPAHPCHSTEDVAALRSVMERVVA